MKPHRFRITLAGFADFATAVILLFCNTSQVVGQNSDPLFEELPIRDR